MIRICAGNPEAWLERYRGKQPLYVCILSYTHTGTIPGISAAGITPQARQYTALADGEYLLSHSQTHYQLPPLQAGVSPALISRALLTQHKIPCCLVSTGLPGKLTVPHVAMGSVMASSLETSNAMTFDQVNQLFECGLRWGRRLSQLFAGRYLILGECVVGGTTTAQALLSALGYEVSGLMSSSHPSGNHRQKQMLVSRGLAGWRNKKDLSALAAVAAIGDPMQVVASAIALAASQSVGVLLAGGSQMLAVYALIKAISLGAASLGAAHRRQVSEQIIVGTTRWVAEDASANTALIAQSVGAPYVASEIDFSHSSYAQLRAYERGFVKEGVGAGGCAIAASLLSGWGQSQIMRAVESELEATYWNRHARICSSSAAIRL